MESLDQQLQAAVTALRELGGTSSRKGEAATGAASLNHMTALFQRLVSDAVEEQLADTLPALVALRGELAERLSDRPPTDSTEREFYERTAGALDQVLAGTGVREYDARPGEAFDPLIHTAVGETHRDDLGDAVVSEWLRPGYRTARGKVISPARVRVNRR